MTLLILHERRTPVSVCGSRRNHSYKYFPHRSTFNNLRGTIVETIKDVYDEDKRYLEHAQTIKVREHVYDGAFGSIYETRFGTRGCSSVG